VALSILHPGRLLSPPDPFTGTVRPVPNEIGRERVFNHQPPCGEQIQQEGKMHKGKIATATWTDCEYCRNRYGDNHCHEKDSVKYNLKMDGSEIRCGLFKEVECES